MSSHGRSGRTSTGLARLGRIGAVALLLVVPGASAASAAPPVNHKVRASISDAAVVEGTGSSSTATFTVSLSQAPSQSLSLNFTTVNGTATAPGDYLSTSGTLSYNAGETSKTIQVTVQGDATDEPNEQFFVNLSGPIRVKIRDGQGIGTINDDDVPPAVSIGDRAITEGDGAAVSATFAVSLASPSGVPVSVTYATANGSATAGADFTGIGATVLTFAPGETTKTITVSVLHDTVVEPTETYSVVLSNNANIADGTGAGTIFDNDVLVAPFVSIGNATILEGGELSFTLTRGPVPNATTTVDYATAPGSAQSGIDFTPASGTVTFAPGQEFATITVQTTLDTIDEGASESLFVNLVNPQGMTITDSQGNGTITDDDSAPVISIADTTAPEGDDGAGASSASFNLTLSNPSASTVTVAFGTFSGTASSGADFTATTGTATFNPGTTSVFISVPVTGDTADESDETFTVVLNSPTNATLAADATGQATIVDDDPTATPSITISDPAVVEGDTQAVVLSFHVSLSDFSDSDVTVVYATANGSAGAGDYTATGATLAIPAGSTGATILVTVTPDFTVEFNETVLVNLSSATGGGVITDAQGVGTIVDNDQPSTLTVSVGDAAVAEGDTVDTVMSFPLTLSGPSATPVSVSFVTADGTATAGDDYVTQSGTVFFAVGETTQTVQVTVEADTEDEPDDEVFYLNLTGSSVGLSDPQGAGTIRDNDAGGAATSYVINDPAPAAEGGDVTFMVTRSGTTTATTSVQFATSSGTAASGLDFDGVALTDVTFGPGQTTQIVNVETNVDALDEADTETFFGGLFNPGTGVIIDGQGLGQITDDVNDLPPTMTVFDATSVTEGSPAVFTISLSAPSGRPVTIDYATATGSATSSDFTSAGATRVLQPGETSFTISVPTTNDTLDEDDEAFTLSAQVTNATPADTTGSATINDNDAAPTLLVSVGPVTEGDTAIFTVSLDAVSAKNVSALFATSPGTATADVDYTSRSGSITINAGQTSTTISVSTLEDALLEPSETFVFTLSGEVNAALPATPTEATITDDDPTGTPATSYSIDDPAIVTEGGSVTFTITRSGDTTGPSTVRYATAPGTAVSPADYTAAALTPVSFSPGELTETVTVQTASDTLDEADPETFFVNLTNPSLGGAITKAQGLGRIGDDANDLPPTVNVSDAVAVTEGTSAVFTISISASGRPVTIDFTTSVGSASSSDFTTNSGTRVLAPGETSFDVSVLTTDDALDEDGESFSLTATPVTNASAGDLTGVGTIVDGDEEPTLSVSDVTVTEGSDAVFTISISEVSGRPVTVNYATAPGSATSSDFTGTSANRVLQPGETSFIVSVTTTDDALDENDENFTLSATPVTNATILDGTGSATITDGDAAPTLSVSVGPVTEGDTATFTVSLSAVSAKNVTASFATSAGTATAGIDYSTTTGSIAINAGETTTTIPVNTTEDLLLEPSETFALTLSGAVNATIPPAEAQTEATITDDDPTGTPATSYSIDDPAIVTEGGSVTFTITRSGDTAGASTVQYATASGTAETPADYTAVAATTVSFGAGDTTETVTVSTATDTLDEADPETFFVNLSNPSFGSGVVDAQGLGRIGDDANDLPPTVAVGDAVAVTEGASAVFTISISAASGRPVTIDFTTSPGSATALDFTTTSGTRVLAPGETSFTVSVPTTDDALDEFAESFTLTATQLTNATFGDGTGAASITDGDPEPTLSVTGVTVNEGSAAVFTVTLSAVSAKNVTASVATRPGTATAGIDYATTTGTIAINAGATSTTVSVNTVDDAAAEAAETFFLTLSAPANAGLGTGEAQSTIAASDAPAGGGGGGGGGGTSTGTRKVATGYRMVASDGGIFTFGDAPFFGSTGDIRLNRPIVGMATTPSGDGYWLVATDGGIFAFGDAGFFGSTGDIRLNRPIVGMETTPSGNGYWLVADDGGIFAFGDAAFHGSTGAIRLNRPIIGMETTPSGNGYWLVAVDGGIFAFGDAVFHGSTGDIRLNQPIVGMAASPSGNGYRLVATDGGIFAFGDALFLGSTGDIRLNQPIVGMAASPTGAGYWLVATDGGIFTFGDAQFLGSTGDIRLNQPINGMAPVVRTVPTG